MRFEGGKSAKSGGPGSQMIFAVKGRERPTIQSREREQVNPLKGLSRSIKNCNVFTW